MMGWLGQYQLYSRVALWLPGSLSATIVQKGERCISDPGMLRRDSFMK